MNLLSAAHCCKHAFGMIPASSTVHFLLDDGFIVTLRLIEVLKRLDEDGERRQEMRYQALNVGGINKIHQQEN